MNKVNKVNKGLMRSWAIALLVMLLLAVCLLPLPRSINRKVAAVRWCPETQEVAQISIEIQGTYMDYLLRTDYFFGDIAIEGLPMSQKAHSLARVYCGREAYPLYWMDDEALLHAGGFIVAAPGFRSFMIGLHDANGTWDGKTGTNITAPASTREEAIAVTRNVCSKYGGSWLSQSKWMDEL